MLTVVCFCLLMSLVLWLHVRLPSMRVHSMPTTQDAFEGKGALATGIHMERVNP